MLTQLIDALVEQIWIVLLRQRFTNYSYVINHKYRCDIGLCVAQAHIVDLPGSDKKWNKATNKICTCQTYKQTVHLVCCFFPQRCESAIGTTADCQHWILTTHKKEKKNRQVTSRKYIAIVFESFFCRQGFVLRNRFAYHNTVYRLELSFFHSRLQTHQACHNNAWKLKHLLLAIY